MTVNQATVVSMFKIMLALHLLAAVFAIGPLVGAATTAAKSLRTGDAEGAKSSARTIKIYSYASLVVVIFGFGLLSSKNPHTHKVPGDFGDLWIWLSVLLWVVAVALSLGVISPSLEKAGVTLKEGGAVDSLKGRVAASGGIVGLIFAAIVFLMVYQPGK